MNWNSSRRRISFRASRSKSASTLWRLSPWSPCPAYASRGCRPYWKPETTVRTSTSCSPWGSTGRRAPRTRPGSAWCTARSWSRIWAASPSRLLGGFPFGMWGHLWPKQGRMSCQWFGRSRSSGRTGPPSSSASTLPSSTWYKNFANSFFNTKLGAITSILTS